MAEDSRPSIKNEETYEALREDGASKEKAARIANAQAAGEEPGKKGGKAANYEDRTKQDLYDQAQKLEIEGRSEMTKAELIEALRNR